MKRIFGILGILLAAGAAQGCITMSVSSHLQPGVVFSQYHTWEWGPADNFPVGDPRLDNNMIFKDRLEGAVEKALAARGYTRVESGGQPDFLLHYHANVNQRFQVNEPEQNCWPNCASSVIEYDQGTLVIDMVDAKTDKLLWRGWAQDSMQGIIDNQALLDRKVDEAITKMMVRFPSTF